jgi:quercetin dioxygenase-like cupin family protein
MAHERETWVGASDPALLSTGAEEGVDLAALARAATAPGAAWTHQSADLDVNLLVFASGEGVEEHVNAEVDVLLVGIAGVGAVTVDGTRHILTAGQAIMIPKGARRSTKGVRAPFAYVSCHRRRAGLWPGR